MKQKLYLLILLALSSLYAEAQIGEGCTIKFDYDAAGNRIKRYENCPNNQFREANPDSLAALQATTEEEAKEELKKVF